MVAQPVSRLAALSDEERTFLCTFPSDKDWSRWMVSNDYQELAVSALRYPLERYRADWYVSSNLAISFTRPDNKSGQLAPDIMVAFVPNHPRDAFDLAAEGGFPPFVLEVVSTESRPRDTKPDKKVRIYDLLGAREYVIFDPRSQRRPHLAGYRRTPSGAWEPWPLDERGGLQSAVLGLRLVQDGMLLRLEDAHGRRLPTAAEEVAAAQDDAAQLRAELARLRGEHG